MGYGSLASTLSSALPTNKTVGRRMDSAWKAAISQGMKASAKVKSAAQSRIRSATSSSAYESGLKKTLPTVLRAGTAINKGIAKVQKANTYLGGAGRGLQLGLQSGASLKNSLKFAHKNGKISGSIGGTKSIVKNQLKMFSGLSKAIESGDKLRKTIRKKLT